MWKFAYVIIALLIFGSWVTALAAKHRLITHLRLVSPSTWEKLDRPAIFPEWIVGSIAFLRFIWRNELDADPNIKVSKSILRSALAVHLISVTLMVVFFVVK